MGFYNRDYVGVGQALGSKAQNWGRSPRGVEWISPCESILHIGFRV